VGTSGSRLEVWFRGIAGDLSLVMMVLSSTSRGYNAIYFKYKDKELES
jgi:hypothetical protein